MNSRDDQARSLTGMIAPAVTPFVADDIEWELFRQDIEVLVAKGVDGIGVAGSTGEGAALSDEEIADAVRAAKGAAGDGIPIVAGIIRNATRHAVRAASMAADAGADALLVTPVFYSGGTAEDNLRYYAAIAEAVPLPVIVYNVAPTNQIEPELMLQLSEIDGVIGIKQVGAEGIAGMVATCGDRTRVYSATDAMLYSTYVAGAVGAVSALVTVAPDLCVRQWKAFQAGDHATAADIQKRLSPIAFAYAARPFTSKVKAFIQLQGRDVGECRSPIGAVTEEQAAEYRKLLVAAGMASA